MLKKLECVVCAYLLADYLSFANLTVPKKIDESIKLIIEKYSEPLSDEEYNITLLKQNLKNIMWNNVGIIRSEDSLNIAKNEVLKLINNFKRDRKCFNIEEYEYRNMLTIALLIIEGALNRKESRGAHTRIDYKQTNDKVLHTELLNRSERMLVNVK